MFISQVTGGVLAPSLFQRMEAESTHFDDIVFFKAAGPRLVTVGQDDLLKVWDADRVASAVSLKLEESPCGMAVHPSAL